MKTSLQILILFFVCLFIQETYAQCSVDAVVRFDNNRVYFFQGDEYSRFNIKNHKVDPGYPKKIQKHWGGVWADGVDAAMNYDEETIYLFKGSECIRYSKKTHKALPGYPKLIRKEWTGAWSSGVDAALDADAIVYLFKGNEVIMLDKKSRTLKMQNGKAKHKISDIFNTGSLNTLSAGLNYNNGKFYLFKDEKYVRITKSELRKGGVAKMDAGYPKATNKWPGLNCQTEAKEEEKEVATTKFRVKISYLKCENVDDSYTFIEEVANRIGVYKSTEEVAGMYVVSAKNFDTGKYITGNRNGILWYREHFFEDVNLAKGESQRIDEEIHFKIPTDQLEDVFIIVRGELEELDNAIPLLKRWGEFDEPIFLDDDLSNKVRIPVSSIGTESKKYVMDHRDQETHLRTIFYVQRLD